jgi:hypothetical protein
MTTRIPVSVREFALTSGRTWLENTELEICHALALSNEKVSMLIHWGKRAELSQLQKIMPKREL